MFLQKQQSKEKKEIHLSLKKLITESIYPFIPYKTSNRINIIKSKQAYIPHTPKLLKSAAYNEWQCHAFMMGNQTENHNRIQIFN